MLPCPAWPRPGVTTAASTNLAIARLDRAGNASYDFRLSWRWSGPADLTGADYLHVGSLGAVLAPGAAAVRAAVAAARRAGIPVSYDPNVRPALLDRAARAEIEALAAAADLVKVSEDDLAWLYPDLPALEDRAAVGQALRHAVTVAAVACTHRGAAPPAEGAG